MKKVLALVLAAVMLMGMMTTVQAEKKIKIGISIWSSTDTLGSECKRIIDAAAAALEIRPQRGEVVGHHLGKDAREHRDLLHVAALLRRTV